MDSIVESVLTAEKDFQNVELHLVKTKIKDLIENYRIVKDICGDLNILKFKSGENLIGTIWTYTAQPEITARENVQVSGDYPGLVCEMMEQKYGGVSLFGLGLCGAQSPIYCEQGFEKMQLFANEVFKVIDEEFNNESKLEITPIEIRNEKVRFTLENTDYQLLFKLGIFERELVDNQAFSTVSKLRIGNFHMLHIPGEPFPGLLSKTINDKPELDIMVISNSNDSVGYFIPLEQFSLKAKDWVDDIVDGKFIGHENESIGSEA